jgi:protein-S-isoprenylcysteine O-methyltransferase Ste14
MRPLHAAYAGFGCFFLIEPLLRQGAEARSFAAPETDRGTTSEIGRAFGLNIIILGAMPLLNRADIGRRDNPRLAWWGVAVMSGGLALRAWSARVLGASYTRTLRTSAGQRIVALGPYRLVRHPGYLGVLLLWLGAACAADNWIAAAPLAPLIRAYYHRMQAEEAMLSATFGDDYRHYRGRTWRLIPLLY